MTRGTPRVLVAVVAAVLAAAALAGCLHDADEADVDRDDDRPTATPTPGDRPTPTGPPPVLVAAHAVLTLDPAQGWVNETVTLDGRESFADDGTVVRWTFDLGDGTVVDVTSEEDAVIEHEYAAGGVYHPVLVVQAEDANGTGAQDVTVAQVTVNARHEVPQTSLDAGILLPSDDRAETPFPVGLFATAFEVNLTLESDTTLVGSSEGTVRVLDPDGEVVAEETFDLSPGADADVRFEGSLNRTGEHVLEVELESGQVTYEGDVLVFYGLATAALAEDEADPEDES